MIKINRAFTLLEIAISLVIIGILISGIIGASSMISESREVSRRWHLRSVIDYIPDILFDKKVELWYDARNVDGNYNLRFEDRQAISEWKDLSINQNHAIQTTASKQPKFSALDDSIIFDGNDYMPISKKYYLTANGLDNVYIFVVFKSSSTSQQIFISFDRSEYWRLSLRDDAIRDQIAFDTRTQANSINDFGGGSYTDGQKRIILGFYDKNRSPNKALYVDGVPKKTGNAHGGYGLGSGARRYGFIGIGSEANAFDSSTGPDYFFNGNMYELIVIEKNLTEKQIAEITSYLSRKWKITNTVDSDNDGVLDISDKFPDNSNDS